MQYKALRTFSGAHGFITQGDVVELEDSYGKQLAGRKPPWVEPAGQDSGPQPTRHQAIPAAPEVKAAPLPIGVRPAVEKPAAKR